MCNTSLCLNCACITSCVQLHKAVSDCRYYEKSRLSDADIANALQIPYRSLCRNVDLYRNPRNIERALEAQGYEVRLDIGDNGKITIYVAKSFATRKMEIDNKGDK